MADANNTINGNKDLAKLKNEIQNTISFLEAQAANEATNKGLAKSDWLQGVCEGKQNSYETTVSILKNNLSRFDASAKVASK